MMINLPSMKTGDQIILSYKPPILIGQIITAITLVLLLLSVAEAALWQGKLSKNIMLSVSGCFKQFYQRAQKKWGEDPSIKTM